jgi:diguanylate cyclase (GGDEF)-like protein
LKRAPSLVAPALLLPIAALVALSRKLPDSLATAVDAAPLLVFGGGMLLGLVTRRGRLVVGVVVLALADCALVHVGGRTVFDAVALLLPLNIAVVVWLGEENPFVGRGALMFGITLLQAAIVAALQHPSLAPVAASLDERIIGASFGMWTALPQLSVFAFAASLGLILTRFLWQGHSLAAGAAWALVASFLALDGARSGGPANVHMATAGLLLLVGATWEPRHVARPDPVTGLPARLEFNRALRRLPRRYAIAFLEIDEFVRFREAHGPEAARRMLRLVARPLRRIGGGRAFYCEGHTFAALFLRASAKTAVRHLDAVRSAVEDITLDVSLSGGTQARHPAVVERTVSVTVSAGVADTNAGAADAKQVLEAAERALARAKQGGMNRVSR